MAVELATAYVTLIPSARGIAAAIKAELTAADMQAAATQAGEEASSGFAKGFKGVAGLLAAVGVAEGLKSMVSAAAGFQAQTELLVTAGGEAQSALAGVRNGIEQIAVATGTSTSQLAEGMYTLEKAGLRGADGLGVLRVAAEAARAENVDLGTMTNALTSIMRSYNLPASAATQITNQLVAASGAAKTTMAEFAGSLSTVLPVASAAGLSFAQVGGAIATLTSHGTSAQEATQELASTIRNLQAPNSVASKEMAQFGINSNTVSLALGRLGLTGTLTELTQAITSKMGPSGLVMLNAFKQSQGAAADMQIEMSKMPPSLQAVAKSFADGQLSMTQWRKEAKGLPADQRLMMQGFMSTYKSAHSFNDLLTSGSPAAQTYAAALEKMLGGATGLNTALMLTGGSSETFARNVDAVAAAGRQGGKDISTWAETQKNFNVQMSRLGEVAQTTSINVGSKLLPVLTSAGSWVANHLGTVTALGGATLGLGSAVLAGAVALKVMTAAQGVYNVLTGEAAAKTGLQALALTVQKGVMLAASGAAKAMAAAQWLLNAAMDANPIVLIVAALAALAAGLVLAYQHSAAFRNAVEDAWKAVQSAAKAIGGAFVDAWHAVAGAFDSAFTFLKQWGPLILTAIVPVIGIPLLIAQHWQSVLDFFEQLPGRVVGFLAKLPGYLEVAAQDAIAGFIVGLAYAAIGIWDFFTKLVPTAIVDIGDFAGQLAGLAGRAIVAMAAAIASAAVAVWGFFSAMPGKVAGFVASLPGVLSAAGSAALNGLASGASAAWGTVAGFFSALPGRIGGLVSGAINWLFGAGQQVTNGLGNGISAAWGGVVGWFANLPGTIGGMFRGCVNWLIGAGEQIMNGLLQGIQNGLGAVQGFVSGIASKIVSWKGPPAYDATILIGNGQLIMQGLLSGIRSQMPNLQSTLADVTATVANGVGTGQIGTIGATSAPGVTQTPSAAPFAPQINVTAYDPATAAREMAAEIGWLQLTRGQ